MNALFTGLRAALFDLDGTLIETHIDFPLLKRGTLALAERHGLSTSGLENLDTLAIVERLREWLESEGKREEALTFRRDAFAMLEEIEVSHCSAPVRIQGAAELLRELRRCGIRVGVVTRNCRRVSEQLLAFGELESDALLTRDDVPLTKPHPAHLLSALNVIASGVAPPDCLMVGDHWMDVQGGHAAGMRTAGIMRGRPDGFYAPAMPDLLIGELRDLLPLLAAACAPVPA